MPGAQGTTTRFVSAFSAVTTAVIVTVDPQFVTALPAVSGNGKCFETKTLIAKTNGSNNINLNCTGDNGAAISSTAFDLDWLDSANKNYFLLQDTPYIDVAENGAGNNYTLLCDDKKFYFLILLSTRKAKALSLLIPLS